MSTTSKDLGTKYGPTDGQDDASHAASEEVRLHVTTRKANFLAWCDTNNKGLGGTTIGVALFFVCRPSRDITKLQLPSNHDGCRMVVSSGWTVFLLLLLLLLVVVLQHNIAIQFFF